MKFKEYYPLWKSLTFLIEHDYFITNLSIPDGRGTAIWTVECEKNKFKISLWRNCSQSFGFHIESMDSDDKINEFSYIGGNGYEKLEEILDEIKKSIKR